MAKFSLIVSAYKVAPYLRACLDSFLAQTFSDWEAICVDDGSPDVVGTILDEYARRDERFKVIHQENAGVSAARNVGMDAAKAEWLWFVDGDDMLVPNALQCLSDEIDAHDKFHLHLISFDFERVTNEMKPMTTGVVTSRRYSDRIDSRLARALYCTAWTKLFRREDIGSIRFWSHRYREDTAFVIEYAVSGTGWLELNAELYSNRIRPESTCTSRFSKEMVAETFVGENALLDNILEIQNEHPDINLTELMRIHHNNCFETFSEAYFKLSAKECSELLPQWVDLNRRFFGLCPIAREKRVCIFLVAFFHSGFFAKFFVQGLRKLNKKLRQLSDRCRR